MQYQQEVGGFVTFMTAKIELIRKKVSSWESFEITQTSPHSHKAADQRDERPAGNSNRLQLQCGASSVAEEAEREKKRKGKEKKQHLWVTDGTKFGIWKYYLCKYSLKIEEKDSK